MFLLSLKRYSTSRFASFIEGSSDHVTQEEIDLYENESKNAGQLSDDSGEDELLFNSRNRGLELSGRNSRLLKTSIFSNVIK